MSIWTRRDFNHGALSVGGALLLSARKSSGSANARSAFAHPGMLHGSGDLERMRQAVLAKQQPIYGGFERLRDDPRSQPGYTIRGPFAEAGRSPTVHIQEFDSDACACYQCALMGAITGDLRYTSISRKILNAWAGELKTITGVDAVLACGLGGFLYLNGAEILRSSAQASGDEIAAWRRMFREVFLPVIAEFAPFANGNWDLAAVKTVMAIAIFDDDRALYEHGMQYYLYGCGDGRLSHYIYSDGQCQESGRDQAHTQLGLGHMGDCCEMAWQQGLDLYGAEDNRLLKGFEYTARYAIGGEVPFTPDVDRTGKYRHAVISVRHPKIQPIYEQIYNHYANRMGLSAPSTERATKLIRPEGSDASANPVSGSANSSDQQRVSADHPGFGTLAYSRSRETSPEAAGAGAAAVGVRACGTHTAIELQWLPLHGAESYAVERADRVAGRYRTIASRIHAAKWTDTAITQGRTYFYRIIRESTGAASLAVGATAGLPPGWRQEELGMTAAASNAFFNGDAFILEAGGARHDHAFAGGIFVSRAWGPSKAITGRLLPRIASQQLSVGLLARDPKDGRSVALYLSPDALGVDEHPAWSVQLRTLPLHDAAEGTMPMLRLGTPVIRNGRVLGELWFRLERGNTTIRGSISSDGTTWQSVGKLQAEWVSGLSTVGLLLNSGLGGVTTEVVIDHVVLD
jgi:hypothetical protein